MKNFTYHRPETAEAAVALLDKTWGTSELLGGGTDLHALQKEYVAQPDKVISIGGIAGFDGIAVEQRQPPIITISAGCKLVNIATNKTLKEYCQALVMAASEVGGPQIRNMGTLGGNLCQRNRCWYFRDEHVHCLLKDGDKCYALDGENRYHAIFTKGHPCVIVHPSTLAPALIALGAKATVQGPKEKRTVELAKFYRSPSKGGEREHTLAPNEMVLSVTIDTQAGLRSASYDVRQKQSHDWPLVQAVVAFQMDGGSAKNVKIVLGHVAPTPIIAAAAAKAVEGKVIDEKTATAAGEAAVEGAKPLAQNAYKVKLVSVAVKRGMLTAAGQKKYWEA